MKFLRIRITQKYASVVIKLDDQNRALNSVIKRAVIIGTAYPAKPGVGQMSMVFTHVRKPGSLGQAGQLSFNQFQQLSLLHSRHGHRTYAFFWDDAVVLKGACEGQLIAKGNPTRGHFWIPLQSV